MKLISINSRQLNYFKFSTDILDFLEDKNFRPAEISYLLKLSGANGKSICTFIYKQREKSKSRSRREIFNMPQTWEKIVIVYAVILTVLGINIFINLTI